MEKRPRESESPEHEESKIEIGRNRFIEVGKFKGKTYVNIREYYLDDSNTLKPSKKGIALKLTEWAEVLNQKDRVNHLIEREEGK